MCVSFCIRRTCLFWNHEPCSSLLCPVAAERHGRCETCRHRQTDDTCGLTGSPLPEAGGCCHWNIVPVTGRIAVTPAMLRLLAGYFDRVHHVLAELPHQPVADTWIIPPVHLSTLQALGIAYEVSEAGLRVDPDGLVLVVDEPVPAILAGLDVPYRVEAGQVWVELDDLQPPLIFGAGTDGLQH